MRQYYFFILLIYLTLSINLKAQSPLTVYTEETYGGSSQTYAIQTLHTNLGAFDNTIKSFKLQQGYMATFATSSDGTGYNRVFRADDADLEVAIMPNYLNGTVSFIRTMALHDYVTKKGWAGWVQDEWTAVNATWRYDWSASGNTGGGVEYVPIKQNLGWPSWGEIEGKANVTHVLGYNEPDRPDQANISLETIIENWPAYYQNGLRVGAPAYSDPYNGLWGFMAEAEANNFRVDYIPIHSYWSRSQTDWSARLDQIWNAFQRPIWITEWNNGANWTNETWPSGNRLATDANMQKQVNDLAYILNILESKPYVERYSIYNWVEDCRAMVLIINDCWKANNPDWANYTWLNDAPVISTWSDGCGVNTKVLTPAGVYYRDHASAKAFNPATEYIPTWNPFKENLSYTFSEDFQNVILHWEGLNGELINNYILEKRSTGETSWSQIYNSTDYTILNAPDAVPNYALYQLKTVGKDNAETTSAKIAVSLNSALEAKPISAKKIELNWANVQNAVSYNIQRASSSGGPYELIASNVTGTTYTDTELSPGTTYYYKIWPVNTGGESGYSSPEAMVTTFLLNAPNGSVQNILVGSGDNQVKLEWDLIIDSQFEVKRSTSSSGPFSSIGITDFEAIRFTDVTASNGNTYYYTVTAFNSEGISPVSETVSANPNNGQHLYYAFNDTFDANPYDQWGLYNATLYPSVTAVSSKGGSGIGLTGDADSYMDIEDGAIKDLTNFTIATWVNLNSTENWVRIFDFGTGTATNMFLTPQNGETGNYRFAIKLNNGTEQQINSSVVPTTGVWTHIVLTMEGSVGIMYINGSEVGRNESFTLNPSSLGVTTQNYIGKSQYNDPVLNASIDDFRIYNRALSTSEIMALFGEDLSIPNECPFVPLYTDKTNLTPDPEMNAFNSYQGWGASNQVLETSDTYCGSNSMKLANGKCSTSLDLNITWEPNSKYRVKFATKTVGGTAKVGFTGTDGATSFVFDNPEWGIVDYTFETGSSVGTGLIFINSCESETATTILIDNYELYKIGESTDPVNDEDCDFTALYPGEPNLAPNREMDNLSAYGGWANGNGVRQVITDNVDAHCGDYVKVTTNGGCNAALDISNIAWEANSTYRLHVYLKTIGGSIGIIANNIDPTLIETFDTNGEWQLIDYTFTTGSNPSTSYFSINGCDGSPDATEVWIDDFELYKIDGLLGLDENISNTNYYRFYSLDKTIQAINYSKIETDFHVFSITGQLLNKGKLLNNETSNLGEYKTGIYIIHLTSEVGVKSIKMVVH